MIYQSNLLVLFHFRTVHVLVGCFFVSCFVRQPNGMVPNMVRRWGIPLMRPVALQIDKTLRFNRNMNIQRIVLTTTNLCVVIGLIVRYMYIMTVIRGSFNQSPSWRKLPS